MAKEKSRGAGRTRSWLFILYPESAPDQWRDELDEEHIQWAESPLHDKDVNPDGELKKPHRHILLVFESVKSKEQVEEITSRLCASMPIPCHGAKGSVRYFAHLDNPEKYQYDVKEIIGHGGLDINELLKPSASERYVLIGEMIDYIRDHKITEYNKLLYYAKSDRFDDWFPLLCDSASYVISSLIKSNRHSELAELAKLENQVCHTTVQYKPIYIDSVTGEEVERKEGASDV